MADDQYTPQDPTQQHPQPDTPDEDLQQHPGRTADMDDRPDHGEEDYPGSGRLTGRPTIIPGGDSGIGRAVALAFAREGADVLISYYNEDEDARETRRLVEDAGRKATLMAGDICEEAHCKALVDAAIREMGGLDILVN